MKNIMPTKKQTKKGFTVIEILVTIFIFTIIGIATVTFLLDVFSLNSMSSSNLIVQEEASAVLKTMTAEIRSMSPSSLGAYPIALAATSSLIFYSDADLDSQPEKIRYFLDGTTLKKGAIKATGNPLVYNQVDEIIKELAHNVANATSSIFSYYDTNYDGVSAELEQPVDISLIRLIKVNVTIDEDALNPPPPLSMTTQVSIRNIKDNL